MKKSWLMLAAASAFMPLAGAQPVQWADNGHYYEFIATPVTWAEALNLAAGMSHLGLAGHLATATSAAENAFISVTVGGNQLGWLAASDDGSEGSWTWRAGPEAGQALTYFNWSGGEPNNCCNGENYLHTNWAPGGLWNDHGGPGNATHVNGFFVEFSSAVPEPGTWLMMVLGLAAIGGHLHRRRG